jgi:hypothetical protein
MKTHFPGFAVKNSAASMLQKPYILLFKRTVPISGTLGSKIPLSAKT